MSRIFLLSSALVAGLAFAAGPAMAQSTMPVQEGGPAHAGSGTPGVNTKSTGGTMSNSTGMEGDQTGTIPLINHQQGGPAPHAGSGTPGVDK
jgi:hypothetical protein